MEKDKKKELVVKCPHCGDFVVINELNCRIFRHGTHIHSGIQINPHLSKMACDALFNSKTIYGCGKPFYVTAALEAITCDYI